jgi:tRNA(Ile)-lysidine synthase
LLSETIMPGSLVGHPMPSLLDKLAVALKSLGWDGTATVVAVSGGPDSVALFRALHELHPGTRLVLAHLNHRLRGEESDADEAFVVRLHAAHAGALDLRTQQIDIAAEPGNMEAAARRRRYEWLRQVATETGCRWLATGHTADDQAETVLHRLLRGAGLRGLRGIAPRQTLAPDLTLIRPLLTATRADVLAFLDEHRQDYRLDRSNLDRTRTRNRIRHDLLPLLAATYHPDIAPSLAQLARQAEEAYVHIEARARDLLVHAERPRAGTLLVFDRPTLAAAPRDLVREMFRLVWLRERFPENDMTFELWDRLAGVAHGESRALDLPGRIHIRALQRVVQVEKHGLS